MVLRLSVLHPLETMLLDRHEIDSALISSSVQLVNLQLSGWKRAYSPNTEELLAMAIALEQVAGTLELKPQEVCRMGHWYNPINRTERVNYPVDGWLPSVSTILDATQPHDRRVAFKRAALRKPFEAAQRKERTSERGTTIHEWISAYLNRSYLPELPLKMQPYSNIIKPYLDTTLGIATEFESERVVYHQFFAGTIDLVQVVNGRYFLLDFKTKDKPILSDSLHDAYLQLSGYYEAFNYETGLDVDALIVVVIYPTHIKLHSIEPQQYLEHWQNRRAYYA